MPDSVVRAAAFEKKGSDAFGKGDFEAASAYYHDSLRLYRSVEHAEGVATELVNLAVVFRKTGQAENAQLALDEVIGKDEYKAFPMLQSKAAFVKSLLFIDAKDYDVAFEWANKSSAMCRTDCPDEGKLLNLKARIHLLKGQYKEAETLGRKAVELNRGKNDLEETANSLRLIGEARLSLNDPDIALGFFNESLDIDKKLGLSSKISSDLISIGRVYCAKGMKKESVNYLKRAERVASASFDKDSLKTIEELMKRCGE